MLLGDASLLTNAIIGCGIEVHRVLGPGLPEPVCETALCIELRAAGIPFARQVGVPLYYKGELIAEYRPDLVVDERVVVEVKCVARLEQIHVAQVLTYLRVTGLRTGLLLNFNTPVLRHGIRLLRL